MNITNNDELFDYLIDEVQILFHDEKGKEMEVLPIALICKKDVPRNAEDKIVILHLCSKDELFDV